MGTRFLPLIALCILLCATARSFAVDVSSSDVPATQPASPQTTYVGFYINDIYDLNLKQSSYGMDFYIWFRWRGDIDPANFEFLNGNLELKEHPYRTSAGGWNYLSYHCRGTFKVDFDYRSYPLDEHDLLLDLEDGQWESQQLQYVIDGENMHNLRPLTLSGWTVGTPIYSVNPHVYKTNFGYPTERTGGASAYSRVVMNIHVVRRNASIYIKTFVGVFISVAIAFLAFVLRPGEADPRFAVGVAAIFAAVSSMIVASNNLPDMPYLTLADQINLFSLFVIFLSLLQSCISLRLYKAGKTALATRSDHVCLVAFPVCYTIVIWLITASHELW